MTTTETTTTDNRFKLGKSPYWLTFSPEDFGLTAGWRVAVSHVPPRSRKKTVNVPLLEFTPRKPVLTLMLGGETFPLFINEWEKKRGNGFVIRGERRLGGGARIVTWRADIAIKTFADRIAMTLSFNVRIEPKPTSAVRLRLTLPVLMTDPFAATSEIAAIREDNAVVVWDLTTRSAIAYVPPQEALNPEPWEEDSHQFVSVFTESVIGVRKKLEVGITIGQAQNGPAVKDLLLEHYASSRPMLLPPAQEWGLTFCQTAAQAVLTLCDKGSYESRGVERAYFLPPGSADCAPPRVAEFFSGFPHFPVDASRALIEWHRFSGDEPVARVAKLTARGVAADFPNNMGTGFGETNRGAFWDKYSFASGPRSGQFGGFDDEAAYSILTNARIARALLDIHAETGEELYATMALNACKWLLLRQNANGYFGGDRYRTTGEWTGGNMLAGAEVIPAFVGAFRATRNEVFIRAAWRIANFVMDEILPHHPAPPILPMERGASIDSAVALASVIRSLLYLDAESPNKRLRDAIHRAGSRLRCFPFDRLRDPEFDYDGQWGGLYECAQAAFWLYNLERDPELLRLALSLQRSVPPSARRSWRAVPAYFTSLYCLAALTKDAKVNLIDMTVKVGWRTYSPNSATRQYVTVKSAGEPALVDHLALVCRGDDHSLLLVLSDQPISAVEITKNGRKPIARDVISNQLVSGNAPMHTFPFQSQWRYGVFAISK